MPDTYVSREIRLAARPTGMPGDDTYAFETVTIEPPSPGHVVVRNTLMSVEPYMRGRMNDVKSYVPPFELGRPLQGAAVGFVLASNDASLPEGTWVQSMLGWREYAAGPAQTFQRIDLSRVPPSAYLGALGTPGFTAWVGLNTIGRLKSDDAVFISSAAGGVGSMAGQLAKLAGARVVGSAGSAEKVAFLTNVLGFDAAFDYHDGPTVKHLAAAAPSGIDLYFDNVGGEQLEAALFALRDHGRVIACGAIAGYNEPIPGPRNLAYVIGKRLRIEGFIIVDHMARYADFAREITPHLASGAIKMAETFFEGLDAAPEAFRELLRGGSHIGKVIVRLAPASAAP